MLSTTLLMIGLLVGLLTNLILLFLLLFKKKDPQDQIALTQQLQDAAKETRNELTTGLRQNREELHHQMALLMQPLTTTLQKTLEVQQQQNQALQQKVEEGLRLLLESTQKGAHESRLEIRSSLESLQNASSQHMKNFQTLQKEKLTELSQKQTELVKQTESHLEKMRQTVDEKLHKTLEERLGRSFQLVSHHLESVQKGLGEMQKLAHDVGSLKHVLTNVKTRGTLGELQLGNILAEIMSPQQYQANVKIKPNSQERVDFAIKLPGQDEKKGPIYLPIDAKFPQEDYIALQQAYAAGNKEAVQQARKKLIQTIKKSAKSIQEKYIVPPYTTNFAILFLSIEGLFSEALRTPDLVTTLQRDFNIVITGPTTFAAMLNSLKMGFKSLAIQKRSSEVWKVLGSVKTEFSKFGTVLQKAQSKIEEAHTQLDKLVGERTRTMLAKLQQIESLPADTTEKPSLPTQEALPTTSKP